MKKNFTLISLCFLMGCSSPEESADWPEWTGCAMPLGPNQTVDILQAKTALLMHSTLSLEQALQLARSNSPALAAAQFQINAQQSLQSAAGQFPNPQVTLGNEKIGLSQPVILGQDLQQQQNVGAAQLNVLEAELRSVQLQVDAQLRGAFSSLLMLQRAAELQQQLVALSEDAVRITQAQISAGELTVSALAATTTAASLYQAQAKSVLRKLNTARRKLATLMNVDYHDLKVVGELDGILKIPKLNELLNRIESLPIIERELSQVQVAKMQKDLAYAQAIPNFDLELYYTNDEQIEAAVLFELPLNSKRNARHKSAAQQQQAARSTLMLRTQEARIALQQMHADIERATDAYSQVHDVVLTNQQQVFAVASARFEAGDISKQQLGAEQMALLHVQLEELQAWLQMMQSWQAIRALLSVD
ncbi:TolC family protein [Planctomycetota bacterium]|mgnify:CR=1 FL=1|nr:TolC family protein [Planctomycetota bacterium]